jgi:hypothetical protein
MALSNSQISDMRDVAYDLRGQPITVKAPLAIVTDYTTGNITRQEQTTSVSKALLGPVYTLSGSDKKRDIRVRLSDVSTISLGYVVVIGSERWLVKSYKQDTTGHAWHLVVEQS